MCLHIYLPICLQLTSHPLPSTGISYTAEHGKCGRFPHFSESGSHFQCEFVCTLAFSVLCCKKGTHRLLGHCLVFYYVCWWEMKFLCGINSQVMYLPVTIIIHYCYAYCVGIWLESVKVIVNMLSAALPCHGSLLILAEVLFSPPCCNVSVLLTVIFSSLFFHEPLKMSWMLNGLSS